PHDSSLTVAAKRHPIRATNPYPVRQRVQHVVRAVNSNEDVHVEIASAPRLLRAVGKRDRAAERVIQSGSRKRVVDGEQAIGEDAHPARRRGLRKADFAFGRHWSASARSSTSASAFALRSTSM